MGSRRLGPGWTGERVFRRTRRSLALCLVAFLTGAAVTPHRHKNDLADLLGDAPSDSGVFLDVSPIAACGVPLAESVRWVDDEPCPACFPFDFATTAAETHLGGTILVPLDRTWNLSHSEVPSGRIRLPASRSPPSL